MHESAPRAPGAAWPTALHALFNWIGFHRMPHSRHLRTILAAVDPAHPALRTAEAAAAAATAAAASQAQQAARQRARDEDFALFTPPLSDAPRYTHAPRFAADEMAAALDHLSVEGFAVIRGVLSESECAAALDLVWQFLEGLGAGIDRADPSSWGTPAANAIFPDAGVIHPYGATHCQAAWYVRSIAAVKASFAALWKTEDLCCSFDGLNLTRPWAIEPSWRTRPAWFHTDQRPFASSDPGTPAGFDLQYVQGFVNLVATSEASG